MQNNVEFERQQPGMAIQNQGVGSTCTREFLNCGILQYWELLRKFRYFIFTEQFLKIFLLEYINWLPLVKSN